MVDKPDIVQLIFAGLTAYQNGKLQDAIKLLNKALDVKKDEWEARLYLGLAYHRTGQRKQAKYQFQTVLDWCQNQEIRRLARVALDSVNAELTPPPKSTGGYRFGTDLGDPFHE
jgi:cytochrome c-type biogenesis protein CcmH/NrfG